MTRQSVPRLAGSKPSVGRRIAEAAVALARARPLEWLLTTFDPTQPPEEIRHRFVSAASNVKRTHPTPQEKLRLYALYKQSAGADAPANPPRAFDQGAIAKWEAWHSVRGKPPAMAMELYSTFVEYLVDRAEGEHWELEPSNHHGEESQTPTPMGFTRHSMGEPTYSPWALPFTRRNRRRGSAASDHQKEAEAEADIHHPSNDERRTSKRASRGSGRGFAHLVPALPALPMLAGGHKDKREKGRQRRRQSIQADRDQHTPFAAVMNDIRARGAGMHGAEPSMRPHAGGSAITDPRMPRERANSGGDRSPIVTNVLAGRASREEGSRQASRNRRSSTSSTTADSPTSPGRKSK